MADEEELAGGAASLASALPPALLARLNRRNGAGSNRTLATPAPADKENGVEDAAPTKATAPAPPPPKAKAAAAAPSSPRKKTPPQPVSSQPVRPALTNSPSKIVLEQRAREEARLLRRAQQEKARLEAPLDEASAFKAMIDAFRAAEPVNKPSPPPDQLQSQRLRVAVRKRPLLAFEREAGEFDVLTCRSAAAECVLHQTRKKVDQERVLENHAFAFDELFDEAAHTRAVYERCARPLVASVFGGGRATCFAYGPTGSGKTYSMSGSGDPRSADGVGIYGMVATDLFRALEAANATGAGLSLSVSMFEIYRDQVRDLLGGGGGAKIAVLEDGAGEVQVRAPCYAARPRTPDAQTQTHTHTHTHTHTRAHTRTHPERHTRCARRCCL